MPDEKKKTSFQYGQDQSQFMNDVMKTLVQQDDYRGMGGHGVTDSRAHGTHSQVNIGMGNNTTVNFREQP